MGALYIKDDEAKAMAERPAALKGLTKTAAVKLALAKELAEHPPRRSAHDIAAEFRRASPLRYGPTIVTDKAFFDALYDDE